MSRHNRNKKLKKVNTAKVLCVVKKKLKKIYNFFADYAKILLLICTFLLATFFFFYSYYLMLQAEQGLLSFFSDIEKLKQENQDTIRTAKYILDTINDFFKKRK